MIKQGMINDTILEKKFKILRTSILLGNLNNRDAIFDDFSNTARELDKIKNAVYEEKLASKQYTTINLEEEQEKLESIIGCIQDRVNERNNFVNDYMKITSNYLDDLDPISLSNDIDTYKLRLSNIEEYLNNCSEINLIKEKIVNLREQLNEKYNIKDNNDTINLKLEEELILEFNKFISSDEYYSSLNYSDIDSEINKLFDEMKEKETVMNTFISSYDALLNAGITGSEKEEYSSYVKDARDDYYESLEKKFILDIYKLVLDKETDYDKLYEKREKLNVILYERDTIRKKLGITKRDNIDYFVSLCNEQFNIIKSQKYILEDIDNLVLEISFSEDRLNELETANNRQEILDILETFNESKLEDNFEIEENSFEEFNNSEEEKLEEKSLAEKQEDVNDKSTNEVEKTIKEDKIESDYQAKPSNMVIKVKDPVKINVKNVSDTAKLVMKKVVIVLEPKRFNSKRDKLKEAEEALNQEEKESIVVSDKPLDIELNTKTSEDNIEVKEVDNIDEIKINTNGSDKVSIPTEIFIEEPEEEKVDLFSVTDPFLDDNYLVDAKKKEDDLINSMPRVFNIGTVKPNSTLSKIEDTVNENDNVILPTMGLTQKENEHVPIVSENYIN